jgi:hypothetical protein
MIQLTTGLEAAAIDVSDEDYYGLDEAAQKLYFEKLLGCDTEHICAVIMDEATYEEAVVSGGSMAALVDDNFIAAYMNHLVAIYVARPTGTEIMFQNA